MKICMFTNTYLPHLGGVANSVKTFEDEFRALGHQVKVVAPAFRGAEESTEDVFRVPAIQNFNGSDFSVRIALPHQTTEFLDEFQPDIIHSHHPFLLGDAALRAACPRNVPVIFTHHTLYENYTHYVPLNSPALKRAATQLAVEYANLCSAVIAPSASVKQLLIERGVDSPIEAIPTGIDLKRFRRGNGTRFRNLIGIPHDAQVIGHVGRLAEEKNLRFLAEAMGRCLHHHPTAVALIVGDGPASENCQAVLHEWADPQRVFMAGSRSGRQLANVYAAMDLFAFSSHSETQGMVLAEAMAAGKPVVALNAPGVREIVVDGENGLLLPSEASPESFAEGLAQLLHQEQIRSRLTEGARATARLFSKRRCARRVIALYEKVLSAYEPADASDPDALWDRVLRRAGTEWKLLVEKASAVAASVTPSVVFEK